jgi:hypothetical protein
MQFGTQHFGAQQAPDVLGVLARRRKSVILHCDRGTFILIMLKIVGKCSRGLTWLYIRLEHSKTVAFQDYASTAFQPVLHRRNQQNLTMDERLECNPSETISFRLVAFHQHLELA